MLGRLWSPEQQLITNQCQPASAGSVLGDVVGSWPDVSLLLLAHGLAFIPLSLTPLYSCLITVMSAHYLSNKTTDDENESRH